MGCCFACCADPVLERLAILERQIYDAVLIPRSCIRKRYVTVRMQDGTVHNIWTVVIDANNRQLVTDME